MARFVADGHLACHGNLAAWGSETMHATDFIFDPNGHGWHLDRPRFDEMLRDAARDAGAEVVSGARVEVVNAGRVRVAGGDVECAWLIDATGRGCGVARRLGAARVDADRLVAFHARFAPGAGADRDSRTMIEAVSDGWWYTARVPSGERVVAFMSDADHADRATIVSAAGFVAALERSDHVARVVLGGGYTLASRPRGADAGSGRLDRFSGSSWTAVGDAAYSFDPLSSQGLLNALYSGLRGGEAVHARLSGDDSPMAEYERRAADVYRIYLRRRDLYYADERRWPDSPFWHRRLPTALEVAEAR
jgi:flavin-dependent dehydrogenase